MLAFFRRQKWLWVLLIAVFSFALVVGLVPMGQGLGHVHFTTDVARVGSEAVSASEFQTAYYNAVNQMGAGVTPEVLAALGFETQVVDQLINQYSMIAEAKRLGLNVSGAEIERAILENPSFQENGAFIGLSRYQDLLIQNGYTVVDFENLIRNEVLMAKLYNYLTAAATVSDEEVESEYRNQNERVQLDFLVLDGPSLESQVVLADEELEQFYQTNVARYTMPATLLSRCFANRQNPRELRQSQVATRKNPHDFLALKPLSLLIGCHQSRCAGSLSQVVSVLEQQEHTPSQLILVD